MKIFIPILLIFLFILIYSCNEAPLSSSEYQSEIISEFMIYDSSTATSPIEPYFPIPSTSQLSWQNSDIAMFIHYGMNTFTNVEWGNGTETPEQFNPQNVNAEQWIEVAKQIGFEYVILTVKHHDGFCLWQTEFTEHSIKNSPYQNGRGDIVKEFTDACLANDIKVGLYYSLWDRHETTYATDDYNVYLMNQLRELLTNYGEISEIWFDGANEKPPEERWHGEAFNDYFELIRNLQPNALVAILGPDIRWVGNEDGYSNETEWSVQQERFGIQEKTDDKRVWYPSECDVSIRPGWFYHESEDNSVKTVNHLLDIYFRSVGMNSNLLLNVPANSNGEFHTNDITRLVEWRKALERIFAKNLLTDTQISASSIYNNSIEYTPTNCIDNNRKTFWVSANDTKTAELEITLPEIKEINIVKLEEAIRFGQRIKSFNIYFNQNNKWEKVFTGSTIGKSRICIFDKRSTDKIKIEITDALASPTLRLISAFSADLSIYF